MRLAAGAPGSHRNIGLSAWRAAYARGSDGGSSALRQRTTGRCGAGSHELHQVWTNQYRQAALAASIKAAIDEFSLARLVHPGQHTGLDVVSKSGALVRGRAGGSTDAPDFDRPIDDRATLVPLVGDERADGVDVLAHA